MEKSYTIIYQGDIVNALEKNGITKYMILNKKLAIIYVLEDFDEKRLNKINEIAWWEIEMPLSSLIELQEGMAGGESVTNAAKTDYIYNNPYVNIDGTGILIAIIDSGIEYLHPDFIREDGTSKIVAIWDQESEKNPPPEGMLFGSEFSRKDINDAISKGDSNLSKDTIGTGTIAAGITSGSGRLNQEYKGVATNSELVIVKLREYKGKYKEGKINYIDTDFLAGIKYVLDISKKEKKIIIINITVADRSREYIITNLLDTFSEIRKSGVVLVSGAGNEGNTDIHYEGSFTNKQEYQDILIQVGNQKALDIAISPSGPGKIAANLISPFGEISYTAQYAPDLFIFEGQFNLANSIYRIDMDYPWLFSGNQELKISVDNIKPGIWTLRLYPEFIIIGQYNVYLPNKNIIDANTRFIDSSANSTVTLYALTERIITVGAYNDRINSMWIGSSKGSLRGRLTKPNLVAPGVDIISTYINKSYAMATGTGISGSIVVGILALIIEYIRQRKPLQKRELFTNILKTYLMLGSTKDEMYLYPNTYQGYGVVDLEGTINAISKYL